MKSIFNQDTLKKSIVLIIFFLIITIISYNLLKGNRIILPDLEEELWDSKDFFLLKAIGISLIATIILAYFTLYNKKQHIYAVTKPIKINNV